MYLLQPPQEVSLTTSASPSSAQQGSAVVLHVQRRTSGKWKQVPRNEVISGQCWVYQPPPESEAEVADSVQWDVVPENAVTFHNEYRLDHTRIVTVNVKGKIKLTPLSPVKCEKDRLVEGPPIRIDVS